MSHRKTATYILAAKIAAHLHFATNVARQLSLTAKNAHAVSARAGQQASGFRAITSFIEDLATNTISQATEINRRAVEISNLATNRERTARALEHFRRVRETASDAGFIESIDAPTKVTESELADLNLTFRENVWDLELQLRETQQQIRAADIISSTSKVEASQAGTFKPQLEVIALNISESASQIKEHLNHAYRLLAEASESLPKASATS